MWTTIERTFESGVKYRRLVGKPPAVLLLHVWLSTTGIRKAEFAETAGMHKAELTRYLMGRYRPQQDRAKVIERCTRGFVPATSWRPTTSSWKITASVLSNTSLTRDEGEA